jgi:peptide-methionine (R)-S-oxide reductase
VAILARAPAIGKFCFPLPQDTWTALISHLDSANAQSHVVLLSTGNSRGERAMLTRRDIAWGGANALAVFGIIGFARMPCDADAAELDVAHTDAEWRKLLRPEQYAVLREGQTEQPFTSPLDRERRAGTYSCGACGLPLFSSQAKFDSRTGWPSFWKPLDNAVRTARDTSQPIARTQVNCRRCQGHLGHEFGDGPKPTGLRYCINGSAMNFAALAA